MTIGERIRDTRKMRGLTQREVGEKCGIAESTIRQYELGKLNPKIETLKRIADALDVPVSYLSQVSVSYIDTDLQRRIVRTIREKIDDRLLSVDPADLYEAFGTYDYDSVFKDALDGQSPMTLSRLEEIADKLGVTLDYLTGRTDDPQTTSLSLQDYELEDAIQDAEENLLETVRKICGMDIYDVAKAYATGRINEVWNPMKIEIVREYLEDSAAILRRLISSQITTSNDSDEKEEGAPNGEHQTD